MSAGISLVYSTNNLVRSRVSGNRVGFPIPSLLFFSEMIRRFHHYPTGITPKLDIGKEHSGISIFDYFPQKAALRRPSPDSWDRSVFAWP